LNKALTLPDLMGKMSLRLQGSTISKLIVYLSLNLGLKKKPVQFSSSISYSKQFLMIFKHKVDKTKSFNILTVIGLAKD
jgi:outer membrane protein insertion porin family